MILGSRSFYEFLSRCYSYLMEETTELPPTLIHIDIVGLIKVVDGWTCFDNILQPVKDLYLCSIMYLSMTESLDEFKDAVISLLTLCQSPFQSDETEARKSSLWANLTTDAIQQMNQEYIQYVTGEYGSKSFNFLSVKQNPVISSSPHDIYDYISQLKLEAFGLCDFNTDAEKTPNDYYCPIVLENLLQLLVEFPSWTKIVFNKPDTSTLVAWCSTEHLSVVTMVDEVSRPLVASKFLMLHTNRVKRLVDEGNEFVKGKEFHIKERSNNHAHLTNGMRNKEIVSDSRIEISLGGDAEGGLPAGGDGQEGKAAKRPDKASREAEDLNLAGFKATLRSTIHSLIKFDECVFNMINDRIMPGQEMTVCKVLLDCCAEMKSYEKYLGTIAGVRFLRWL